ncbi:MAG: dethiobiotin synthase [Candidatus Omnitrophica bacterium]|jgi:dethiobiotin synthetase|nr:dethiobiotin synthase [Candidatus Omnitrophota bacterium]
MKAIFVTGTDTAIGKTLITGLLARFIASQGKKVITQKWVQTGDESFSADILLHLKLMDKTKKDIDRYLNYVSPYVFKFPASAHLASSLEKRIIQPAKIKKSFKILAKDFDFIIIEGIGGVLVPFNRRRLVIDIVKELDLTVLIVAGNKLGAINHTLLTVEALKRRGLKILGVIFNNCLSKTDKLILEDNLRIVREFLEEKVLGSLPFSRNKSFLYRKFIPIGKKILSLMQ